MKKRKKTSLHFQKMLKRNLQRSKERMLLPPKTSLRLLKELKI